MFKDMSRKLFDAAGNEVILGGAEEVQVEPVGELHLKTDPDDVRTFFNRNIYDEPTGQIVQELGI